MSDQLPPAGWYPDPWRVTAQRWWDGRQWTPWEFPPAPSTGMSTAEVASARRTEDRIWKWARLAVCWYGLVFLLQAITVFALAGQFRGFIHSFMHDLQAARPGEPPTIDLNAFYKVQVAGDVGEVLLLAVGIVFLIWQYNAARVARGLGYPARTSPGFGVASWFIPIVNLWFPYWALSDCLPPGHCLRPTALWAWFAYLGSGLLVAATAVTAYFSELGAVIPFVLGLATMATAVTLGCRLVSAVNRAHHLVVQPNTP